MLLFGLVPSWWALLAVPAAVLIGFAFAAIGLACTTFMRSWVDFDYVNVALVPLFLFSATFFPISQYPAGLQAVIRVTPLYQGVVLVRALVLGAGRLVHCSCTSRTSWSIGAIGLRIAARRIVPPAPTLTGAYASRSCSKLLRVRTCSSPGGSSGIGLATRAARRRPRRPRVADRRAAPDVLDDAAGSRCAPSGGTVAVARPTWPTPRQVDAAVVGARPTRSARSTSRSARPGRRGPATSRSSTPSCSAR